MHNLLLVGLGGFLGSIARYTLGGLVLHMTVQQHFPLGTFTVNVLGCLVVGLMAGATERYELFGPDARLFLFTGLLGGFTTFSAFSLDAVTLWQRGQGAVALAYVAGSVGLSLAALLAGLAAGQKVLA